MNISLLVGLKNNLDYNKHFYETTRKLYPTVELCFVSYGSTDGTHEWLESITDNNLKYFYSDETKTFSDTFNKATELATSDYVAYLHNDIVLAPGFLENLQKHVGENNVVSYTTIEPPIFAGHERPGKLIYDLGTELETFDIDALYQYTSEQQQKYSEKTEPGITFFMCMPRHKLLDIGGMDKLFNPMFCEDDDLIRRWKLLGMNCFTSLDAICYHFVSKTSRFSEEYANRTQQIELKSNRNFIRKWGTRSDAPKYDIGIRIKNCNNQLLEILEPWCNNIYTDQTLEQAQLYVIPEECNTKYEIYKRVLPYDRESQNDIIVDLDANYFNQDNMQLIQQLPEIIQDSGDIGIFKIGNLNININNIITYENQLIKNGK